MKFQWKREDFIPKGSCRMSDRAGLGEVYVYTFNGKPAAKAFVGKAAKSTWDFTFRSEEARRAKIVEFFSNLAAREARKIERRKKNNEPHTLTVGTIITNSWGYDQTNVDWYVIVGTTANFVTLREIAAVSVETTGAMSGTCTPAIDVSDPDPMKWGVTFASDEVTRHKASGRYVSMRHGCGSVWDGTPMRESWYA
jgi:hypothetical protein